MLFRSEGGEGGQETKNSRVKKKKKKKAIKFEKDNMLGETVGPRKIQQ